MKGLGVAFVIFCSLQIICNSLHILPSLKNAGLNIHMVSRRKRPHHDKTIGDTPIRDKTPPNDLLNLDNKMDKLNEKMKDLKREKLKLLDNKKGLKMLNNTQIDDLKINKYTPVEEEEIFTNPFLTGLRVIIENDKKKKSTKTEHFELQKSNYNFTNIGGYDSVKEELMQCADILLNYEKYQKYNVRVPKGIILEGPPGNGKTLLVKCFSGEIDVNFISVSGSEFQEMYVGVGASRIRELFKLASNNKPCIIFIDEIDAVGRKRSTDTSGQNSERDSTLNELLVQLDGFKSNDGIFIMGATNRLDLLDHALIRPGRIDKSIYIGMPNTKTREMIIKLHIQGKPCSVTIEDLIEMTQGFSGAQIENLLNEAMLLSIRNNREMIKKSDLDFIFNRILVGTQSTENVYTEKLLYQISIHEMGHAIVGLLSHNYNKLLKVSLNMWSHKSPGYTLFETKEDEYLNSKSKLMSHLMVLLAGRIAEEEFFGEHITTGASKDLEDAKTLSISMINDYGMGNELIYNSESDKSKEIIDKEVKELIDTAYNRAKLIIISSKSLIDECAKILMVEHVLTPDFILKRMKTRYSHLIGKPGI